MRVNTRLLLILIMFALIAILTMLTIVLTKKFVDGFDKVYRALSVAMANDYTCKEHLGMCPVELSPDVPPPNVSLVSGGDNKVAIYALQLVFITGEGKKLANQRMKGLTSVGNIYVSSHDDDNMCRMWTSKQGSNQKILWIAIRGTSNLAEAIIDLNTDQVGSFAKKVGVENYKSDLRQNQRRENINNAPGHDNESNLLVPLSNSGLKGDSDEEIVAGAQVHYGFYVVWKAIQKSIVKHIEDENPDYIVMGSHSLGAAVATIGGLELVINGTVKPEKLFNYTFAAPRSGNPKYAKVVDTKVPNLYRYFNTSDLIPTLPLAVMPNWTNVTPPYEFSHAGFPNHFTYNGGSVANNHSTGTYQKGIQYLIDNSNPTLSKLII